MTLSFQNAFLILKKKDYPLNKPSVNCIYKGCLYICVCERVIYINIFNVLTNRTIILIKHRRILLQVFAEASESIILSSSFLLRTNPIRLEVAK